MSFSRLIWCCGCGGPVQARLIDGREAYPHRRALSSVPFWKCDTCGNFVGCHHKTKDRTRPLGCIPTPEIKNARQHIHKILDPIWKSGAIGRRELYLRMAEKLEIKEYHTAEIATIPQARKAYWAAADIKREMEA